MEVTAGIVWVITAIAALSVSLGLSNGIKNVSYAAFAIGTFLLLTVLFLGPIGFLLNSVVQTIGYYAQWFIQISFVCDTFEQQNLELQPGARSFLSQYYEGSDKVIRQIREAGFTPLSSPEMYQDGTPTNMNFWTVFYCTPRCGPAGGTWGQGRATDPPLWRDGAPHDAGGWWISWSPFVGMFISKISRGRTVRQIVLGTMFLPVLYVGFWMTLMGTVGIRHQKIAETALGASPDVYNGSVDCAALGYAGGQPVSEKARALADMGYYVLACRPLAGQTYDVVEPYGGEGLTTFLFIVILVGLTLYFITSSDSGSLVDDVLASGGISEPPLPQKLYWAFTEGATCTALLVAGGSSALRSLQAASIIAGLPYTLALCLMIVAVFRVLKIESGEEDIMTKKKWNTGVLDIMEGWNPSVAEGTLACSTPVSSRYMLVLNALFFPPMSIMRVLTKIGASQGEVYAQTAASTCFWVVWLALLIADGQGIEAVSIIGWVFFFFVLLQVSRSAVAFARRASGRGGTRALTRLFAPQVGFLRLRVRAHYDVYGSAGDDVWVGLFWFFALPQMELHCGDAKPIAYETQY